MRKGVIVVAAAMLCAGCGRVDKLAEPLAKPPILAWEPIPAPTSNAELAAEEYEFERRHPSASAALEPRQSLAGRRGDVTGGPLPPTKSQELAQAEPPRHASLPSSPAPVAQAPERPSPAARRIYDEERETAEADEPTSSVSPPLTGRPTPKPEAAVTEQDAPKSTTQKPRNETRKTTKLAEETPAAPQQLATPSEPKPEGKVLPPIHVPEPPAKTSPTPATSPSLSKPRIADAPISPIPPAASQQKPQTAPEPAKPPQVAVIVPLSPPTEAESTPKAGAGIPAPPSAAEAPASRPSPPATPPAPSAPTAKPHQDALELPIAPPTAPQSAHASASLSQCPPADADGVVRCPIFAGWLLPQDEQSLGRSRESQGGLMILLGILIAGGTFDVLRRILR